VRDGRVDGASHTARAPETASEPDNGTCVRRVARTGTDTRAAGAFLATRAGAPPA
jgi:hypothetical protein